jgi:endo-1,4-beta-xylanase
MLITSNASNSTVLTGNTIRNIGGWDVEYWRDGGTGTMTVSNNGTFSAEWDARPDRNILFRSGRKFGTPQGISLPHNQIGEIVLTFDAAHTTSINSFLSVYGWTARSTVEYYIIDSWGSYAKGRQSPQAVLETTYTIPGEGTYELYVSHERVNQPSIFSHSDTFPQYMAVRTDKRTSGTVSVSEHFRRWEAAGLDMSGALYEVSFCVEAWGSTGTAQVNSLSLNIEQNAAPPAAGKNIPASEFKPSSSIGSGTVSTGNDIVTVTYGSQAWGNVYTYFDYTFPSGTSIADYSGISLDFQFIAGDLGAGKRLFLLAGTPAQLTGQKNDPDIGAWNVDVPALGAAAFRNVSDLNSQRYTFDFLPARTSELSGLSTVRFAVYVPAGASGSDGGANSPTRYRVSNVVLNQRAGSSSGTGGALNTADALNVLRHIAGTSVLTGEQRTHYGLSGVITTTDALNMLRKIAGL